MHLVLSVQVALASLTLAGTVVGIGVHKKRK